VDGTVITILLQIAVAAALGTFAVLSLLIARQPHGLSGSHRAGWQVTAIVFVPYTLIQLSQNLFAGAAYVAGEGHPVYRTYLWLAPLANHSRTLLEFALYCGLFLVVRRGALSTRELRGVALAAAGFMVLGAAIGAGEGPLLAVRHYVNTALIDIAGFVLLAILLLYLLARDTVDRDLWFSLTLHGVSSIFGVLYLTALTIFGYGGRSPIWQLHVIRLCCNLAVTLLALHCYRMARQGKPVPGLLPAPRETAMLT
jgi:hypothetical protein